jgi:hypothetical protein
MDCKSPILVFAVNGREEIGHSNKMVTGEPRKTTGLHKDSWGRGTYCKQTAEGHTEIYWIKELHRSICGYLQGTASV